MLFSERFGRSNVAYDATFRCVYVQKTTPWTEKFRTIIKPSSAINYKKVICIIIIVKC